LGLIGFVRPESNSNPKGGLHKPQPRGKAAKKEALLRQGEKAD